MTTIRFRPTFQLTTRISPAEAKQRIQAAIADRDEEFQSQFKTHHAIVSIADSKRHFWSPWLNLEIRDRDSGSEIACRFSPHPSIWTGFMFAYLVLAVLIFFSVIVGVSQQLASQTPIAYYIVPVWCFLAIALWLASQTGQKLALDEMKMMKRTVEQCLAD